MEESAETGLVFVRMVGRAMNASFVEEKSGKVRVFWNTSPNEQLSKSMSVNTTCQWVVMFDKHELEIV